MDNMEKYFIPKDQAIRLKELGFDEGCISIFRGVNNS